MKEDKEILIKKPIDQLNLFGFESYFNAFDKLYQKNKLPNSILLSGSKGLGKSTFIYHFINYLLSKNEQHKYDKISYSINNKNLSYKMLQNKIHANLFILDSVNSENIKIEQVRELFLFLNKTTYYKGIKIVLLDNAENLNINSSNALLKSIEEPDKNTFFFIINNNSEKILKTIKSRCINFKINFSFTEKKNIFKKIAQDYSLNFNDNDLDDFLYFDSPGNLLKYLSILKPSKSRISENYASSISFFMDMYTKKNDPKILNLISILIQKFYIKLSLKNSSFVFRYYKNLNQLLHLISSMNKFHLDRKNLIFSIDNIIKKDCI